MNDMNDNNSNDDTAANDAANNAANETATYQRKVARDQAASVLAELKKKGMQVHELAPADIDAMKKRAQPVIEKFTKELGEPLVKEVYAEVAKVRGAK